MKIIKKFLPRVLEAALGGLFFYAGLLKHWHPDEFAEAVLAYRLLPESLVGVVAAGLPWVEMAAGLFLIIGLKRRSCLILLGLLAGGFMVIVLATMARGLKIDCGCGLFFPRQVGLGVALTDAFFVAWAAGLYWWELRAGARGNRGNGESGNRGIGEKDDAGLFSSPSSGSEHNHRAGRARRISEDR